MKNELDRKFVFIDKTVAVPVQALRSGQMRQDQYWLARQISMRRIKRTGSKIK